ncbi:MAG: DUF4127 family protein [Chloroflexi bacterium]|nr:MAG: DUF4127 family protein [Chloroflexota bacterium]
MDHSTIRGCASRAVSRLSLLPLDDRPVNYDHPWWLGRAAGIEVSRPPREWLGSPFQKADRGQISAWLIDESNSAEALVIAVDTLGYGGLIPSRQSSAPLVEVTDSLEPLRVLRAERPALPIYAFNILMRVNRSNSAEEEKAYCADYGRDLFRLSYLDDKANAGDANEAEVAERQELIDSIPSAVIADYRAGRARNHAVNRLMLDWAESGLLTYVVIGQDDTAPYGWNIAESRLLRALIARRRLSDRAIVYPGADELAGLLIAAYACRTAKLQPKVFARYSGPRGPAAVTAYEDRPFEDLVKAHLGPLGGNMTSSPDGADLILAVNTPGEEQAEGWLQLVAREPDRVAVGTRNSINSQSLRMVQREMETARKNVVELSKKIEVDVSAGRNVAIVDVAFVNGADLAFADQLLARVPLARLGAYAGWNTAGNSLGSALAQGVVRALTLLKEQPMELLSAHIALLAIHLLDDYAFQGIVRSEILLDDMPALGLAPTFERLPDHVVSEIENRLGRRIAPYVEALARLLETTGIANGPSECHVSGLSIEAPRLPWKRVFEIAITPHIGLM